MSIKYVIDAWAWLEYLNGSNLGLKVKELIKNGNVFTSAVTVAEVISKVERKGMDTSVAFNAITSLSKIIEIDEFFSREAGLLHADIKKSRPNFGLADSFVLQAAINLHAKVLTGDPDFKGLKITEMLK